MAKPIPSAISSALRPGRFDRQVVVSLPDIKGREKILKFHMKRVPLARDVNPGVLAKGTPGFSGADLENLVNEAALLAARRSRRLVTQTDFEDAKDKVMMGAERRSMAMNEEEKRLTAYHEGGHALLATVLPHGDPLHKVTIIPRGMALGLTQQLPEGDRYTNTKSYLEGQLRVGPFSRGPGLSVGGQNERLQRDGAARQRGDREADALLLGVVVSIGTPEGRGAQDAEARAGDGAGVRAI